jgi:nicotinamide-nucleotide amidase
LKVEIITIGNELTSGEGLNINAIFIARALTEQGHQVVSMATTGDDEWQIQDALLKARDRAEAIIVSGGLGAMKDDRTVHSAAQALGLRLVIHKEVLETLREYYTRRGMEITPAHEKLAYLPYPSEILANPRGAAPGILLRHKSRLFCFLPEDLGELKKMFKERILPLLDKERKETTCFRSRTLKIFGITETTIANRLQEIEPKDFSASLTCLPCYPENHLKITVEGQTVEEAEANLFRLEGLIQEKLQRYIFAKDNEIIDEIVGKLLRAHHYTLSVAESCTGGLVAHRLTQVPGSSDYFERGIVAYSNQAKIDLLAVSESLLEKYGAVSAPVAEKMAEGIRAKSQTTLGLSITGIAGPAGGSEEKPVGTVFIALASPGPTVSRKYQFEGDRKRIRVESAYTAIDWVRRYCLDQSSGSM